MNALEDTTLASLQGFGAWAPAGSGGIVPGTPESGMPLLQPPAAHVAVGLQAHTAAATGGSGTETPPSGCPFGFDPTTGGCAGPPMPGDAAFPTWGYVALIGGAVVAGGALLYAVLKK